MLGLVVEASKIYTRFFESNYSKQTKCYFLGRKIPIDQSTIVFQLFDFCCKLETSHLLTILSPGIYE